MVAGTASHVGKSWTATAICRWLRDKKIRVAPFKAQNMSNNSYPCADGGEIGRAQVAQAQACGLQPMTDMNPILLKPVSDRRSQVVVNGKVWKTLDADSYYEQFDHLLCCVLEAYRRLASRFDFVVVEGAGSITELNLKHRDLVNLGLATRIGAPVLLVADIDRGGVFASIVGTFALLQPEERALVRSFVVNRFRGDPALFKDGVTILEQRTGTNCLGVFPFDPSISLDAEDSVGLGEGPAAGGGTAKIAVIRLPHVSNTTDFRFLSGVKWVSRPVNQRFHTVILPGTKNTINDLVWLQNTALADWIKAQHRRGASIIGICGGYQMLGESIEDPLGVESSRTEVEGLRLLPCRTRLTSQKITRRVEAVSLGGTRFSAYEIHMGETTCLSKADAFATLADGTMDGMVLGGCMGTYLHGAFEDAALAEEVFGADVCDVMGRRDDYDSLAQWFDLHVDKKKFEELYLCA